jgi:hypothetical protein
MVTRRQLEELRRLLGDPEECPECGEAFVIGMPGLFSVGYRPRKEGDPVEQESRHHGGTGSKENTLVKISAEELAEHAGVCVVCGKDWKTYPIDLGGLGPKPVLPDPWPYRDWPPSRMPAKEA